MHILDFLRVAVHKGASDIHIKTNSPPMLRIDGRIVPTEWPSLTSDEARQSLFAIMTSEQRERFERNKEMDMSLIIDGLARFRMNVYSEQGAIGAALRVIPMEPIPMDDLSLPPVLKKLALERQGLVLVTGPTGSGKSTTLAAMVDFINTTKDVHIVTIEDPIEFFYTNKKSIVTQRELGTDTPTFPMALKYALRQDPDVILIGEMRDQETILAAMKAAETGHLVLSTLHTTDAVQTITRILNYFPPEEREALRHELAVVLKGCIAQRLIQRSDGPGRVACHEILIGTPTVSDLIQKNEIGSCYDIIAQGGMDGMMSMNNAIFNYYQDEIISLDDALSYSDNPNELQRMMRGAFHGSGLGG
ncbi:MAG: type IV pilus twitching motility protein PilT [Candidatus Sericytochromatia bacterium]|nr:type IV pilus twitching motility protein PilT [Candidatus Sericytochromatia bacterium]